MRFAISLFLLSALAAYSADTRIRQTGKDRFETAFPSGGEMRLTIQSGEVHVVGGDDNKVLVWYEGRNAEEARNIRLGFTASGNHGELEIHGGPRSEFRINIQIPRKTGVFIRVPAGDLTAEGLVGDKNVELTAGNLILQVGNPADYGPVDASVHAGDLNAGPFEVSKGGLFRSFQHQGPGRYRLHAHVGAGDLNLK